MSIKEKYKELKRQVVEDEKELTELENHDVKTSGIYRLHFVEYPKRSNYYSTQYIGSPFKSSIAMEERDILDVVSYILISMNMLFGIQENSYSMAHMGDFIIETNKNYKFDIVETDKPSEVTDLYILGKGKNAFKKSRYYKNYFDWFNPNMTYEKLEEIYSKYGLKFYDLDEYKHVL